MTKFFVKIVLIEENLVTTSVTNQNDTFTVRYDTVKGSMTPLSVLVDDRFRNAFVKALLSVFESQYDKVTGRRVKSYKVPSSFSFEI